MFLFSPKFDWSFSRLPRFNGGCWTLPKCSYFTQTFVMLPKTLSKFSSWPKFEEGCCGLTTWFQVLQGQCLFCHQGQKIWSLFCCWFGYYFASVWKIDTTSIHVNVAVYFAQILKFFARIIANFSALGMRTHPLHTHAVRIWFQVWLSCCSWPE